MSRRVVYDECEVEAPSNEKPDPFRGRRGPRGAARYVYTLADVAAVAGISEDGVRRALYRAKVRIDDFGALVAWLASRR